MQPRKVNPLVIAIAIVLGGMAIEHYASTIGVTIGGLWPFSPPPIAADGFRVLIVEEAQDRSKLPPSQLAIFTSKEVTDYLDSKCVKVNGTPEYRIYDKDTSFTNESDIWKNAMRLERKSLPWIIVSNGRSGYSGPLPATASETLDLLRKYGG